MTSSTPSAGLVTRRDPGTPDEHAGLFHSTLAEYLLNPEATLAGFAIDVGGAHRALALAIDALAPVSNHAPDDSCHYYAFFREAVHWWAIGEVEHAVKCLWDRKSNLPRENLERCLWWLPTIEGQFGENHPATLAIRHETAFWTGKSGNVGEALRLFTELLPDMEGGSVATTPSHSQHASVSRPRPMQTGQCAGGAAAVR